MNSEQAWQSVLGQLQMEMPRASFDTWVRDSRPLSMENGRLYVAVRNTYARDWLENRLESTVNRLLVGILATSDIKVEFVTQDSIGDQDVDDEQYGRHRGVAPSGSFAAASTPAVGPPLPASDPRAGLPRGQTPRHQALQFPIPRGREGSDPSSYRVWSLS